MSDLNPFLLAANTPTPDSRLLPLLRSKPDLASSQDAHGYSLLHAAASYNHIDLLKVLVNELSVDINLKDEDGETCLFVVESIDAARVLVEDLHIAIDIRNNEGQTALEKLEAEEEYPDIALWLRQREGDPSRPSPAATTALPVLPPNVRIGLNTADEHSTLAEQEPDPEFRRRIEELAARDDFQSEENQRELRSLITDAVRDVSDDREVRRRVE
jgi:uncharacterized protein